MVVSERTEEDAPNNLLPEATTPISCMDMLAPMLTILNEKADWLGSLVLRCSTKRRDNWWHFLVEQGSKQHFANTVEMLQFD